MQNNMWAMKRLISDDALMHVITRKRVDGALKVSALGFDTHFDCGCFFATLAAYISTAITCFRPSGERPGSSDRFASHCSCAALALISLFASCVCTCGEKGQCDENRVNEWQSRGSTPNMLGKKSSQQVIRGNTRPSW